MVQLDVLVCTTATRASLTSETESAALTEVTTVSSEMLCMDYIMDSQMLTSVARHSGSEDRGKAGTERCLDDTVRPCLRKRKQIFKDSTLW